MQEYRTFDYTVDMVRSALVEANTLLKGSNKWVKINARGPNVRMHVGLLDRRMNKEPAYLTISYYITNDGRIGREELKF